MAVANDKSGSTSKSGHEQASTVIMTCDTHIGPRMVEDLRPHCPQKYLTEFDAFVEELQPVQEWWKGAGVPDADSPGHYDSAARQAVIDGDKVAAEVLFQFSFNGELIPFVPSFLHSDSPSNLELAHVGQHIYNAWLADFCNALPGRRVGLAHIPLWDIEASVKEVEWAAAAGLRGVNFPGMRESVVPYDDPSYEPLWAACAANDMPLTTHSGANSPSSMSNQSVLMLEVGGSLSRRAIHRMIFNKAFDRHPNLKLVMTEQNGSWQKALMDEMDSVYRATVRHNSSPDTGALTRNAAKGKTVTDPKNWKGYAVNMKRQEPLDRYPSEYFGTNIFVGASFMAHFEALAAIEHGFSDAMMWGSDYPHPEGTRNMNDTDFETSQQFRSMRMTFEGLPEDEVRAMAGLNGIRCYGLDAKQLAGVAESLGAPTPAQLAEPPVGILHGSDGTGGHAFRTEQWN